MGGVAAHSKAGGAPSARAAMPQRPRLQVWFVTVCGCILIWTCLVQLLVPGRLWPNAWGWNTARLFLGIAEAGSRSAHLPLAPPRLLPPLSMDSRVIKTIALTVHALAFNHPLLRISQCTDPIACNGDL
ncbi:hypothetical protein BHM03_00035677 [Ensete ventricosum]|nr:hypothetical protein BHM03_00035677 [Ensete ventricosum]